MIEPENVLEHIASFVCNLKYEDLQEEVLRETKRRIIDSLGCAFGGMKDPAVKIVRKSVERKHTKYSDGLALGMDYSYALSQAAYLNTHPIRVLDWNDTYLSEEPAHPSDNIGAILAHIGPDHVDGKMILLATALAYEIQCSLCDFASLRKCGWDHTYYLQISSAAASGKIKRLDFSKMKHALAFSLRDVPTRQIRSGSALSMAKGLAAAEAVEKGIKSATLAEHGAAGPSEMFEGEFGFFKQIIAGKTKINWNGLDNLGEEFKILKTHIKYYPVEYHAEAAVSAALALRDMIGAGKISQIERLRIASYEAAKSIIGGEEKRRPKTKESADHSIFYILAVSLLKGKMTLEEYDEKNFTDPEIVSLIEKMTDVVEINDYNLRYRDKKLPEFPICLSCRLASGEAFVVEIKKPKGHFANPLSDKELEEKFMLASEGVLSFSDQKNIIEFIWNLETHNAYKLYWTLKRIETKKEEKNVGE